MNKPIVVSAVIFGRVPPDNVQSEKIKSYLAKKYGAEIELTFKYDESISSGFRLEAEGGGLSGKEVYDRTREGMFSRLKKELENMDFSRGDVMSMVKCAIEDLGKDVIPEEVGYVMSVGDGIAVVSGLEGASYGEILVFSSGVKGMVQDLKKNHIGCVLFGDDEDISEGSKVVRTGKCAGVPVGENFLGRVIDPLGSPIDGKGEIAAEGYLPVENPAPGIIDRQPVNKPMETGILTIDSMFPIGRGQRELIIGDRQTGKTAIAVDTVLNQKGKGVICIYVAIGQKNSSVAQLAENLRKRGALDYTIIVNASASDSAPLQYIAPYSGCAMGEYFMNKGKDVLIVYDDLSKHAIAYRSLSLLLERSPGREAYPGDVFYLHSRLLERAAHLSEERGGGSMTALPIVETQAGDVSAYIPTNIISITDGQIFLESDLFFSGQRPAINIGLSVSRVGGDAQTKAVKQAAGAIRLDLAQYREMEVFTQFSSELDDETKKELNHGQILMQLLKQPQYSPYKQSEEVILLLAAEKRLFEGVEKEKVGEIKRELIKYLSEKHGDVLSEIEIKKGLSDELKERAEVAVKEFLSGVN